MTLGSWGLGLLAILLSFVVARADPRRRARATGLLGLAFAAACAGAFVGNRTDALVASSVTFMHAGFSAGPEVFTDAAGNLLEERRYEPFGVPIDAYLPATGHATAPDLVDRDLNPLNKRTEVATGWSDHGARWMAPESARWLTPDPPVSGPDAKFMLAPWTLHPYQYVNQNPATYWDPDGREPRSASDRALRREIVDSLLDLNVPAGPALAAARQLAASAELVDRNTAYHLAVEHFAVAYLEDVPHADNEAQVLASSTPPELVSAYQVLVNPVTHVAFVTLRKADGTSDHGVIFGRRSKSVDFWTRVEVHEMSHEVNDDNASTDPVTRFMAELGAYWIQAGFRSLPPRERAAAIKTHILTQYPDFARYHRDHPAFQRFVEGVSAPASERNTTNE